MTLNEFQLDSVRLPSRREGKVVERRVDEPAAGRAEGCRCGMRIAHIRKTKDGAVL